MNLEQKIEALLFYKNEPIEISKISKLLGVAETETREALSNLSNALANRGIVLLETDKEVSLATNPVLKDLIEQLAKDEMSPEISKASLETLAIILYNGPVGRREIDYVRGVNSTFILRNLAIRGLIEKEPDPKDQRTFKYRASLSLFAHLGIKNKNELPDFATFQKKMSELIDASNEDERQT